MNFKKFSLCMPCYPPSEQHLKRAIDSILDQRDYDNWELIVCFDGKNEEGEKIMAGYNDPRIQYITIEHKGAPAARNAAARLAKGDYLAFFSSDFIANPGMLYTWNKAFEDHPECGFVYGGYDLYENGDFCQSFVSEEFDARQLETANYIDGGFPLRKEVYVEWDESIKSLQDWDFWLTIVKKGVKGYFLSESTYGAEMPKPGGLSHDSSTNWLERVSTIKVKHNFPDRPICVTSLGAVPHAKYIAKILDADYKQNVWFKPHDYRCVYLLGFYMTNPDHHAAVFANSGMREDCVKAVHWIGTDVFMLNGYKHDMLKMMRVGVFDKMDYHLTEYNYTQRELSDFGIKSKVGGNLPIVPFPIEFKEEKIPLPEKFTVGVYTPVAKDADLKYMLKLIRDVAVSLPDIDFVFFGGEKGEAFNIKSIGWVPIEEAIAKTSVLLRFTIHDGLPVAPIQFLSQNRQVITNTPMPYVEFYDMLDLEMGGMCKMRAQRKGEHIRYHEGDYCEHKDKLINRLRRLQKGYGSLTYNWDEIHGYYKSICGFEKYKETFNKILNREPLVDAVQSDKIYYEGSLITLPKIGGAI